MDDNDHLADCHPRPWHQIRLRSGLVIKDAVGATVLLLPFTGRLSEERKARTAAYMLAAIDDRSDRDVPHPPAAPGEQEAIRPRRPLPGVLTSGLGPARSGRQRVDPAGVERYGT